MMEKLIKTSRNNRSGGCILQVFVGSTYHQNLKYNVKRACIFHLISQSIDKNLSLHLAQIMVVKGVGEFE